MEEMHLIEFRSFLEDIKGHSKITQDHYCRYMRDFNPNEISQDYINQYIQLKGNNRQVRGAVTSFLEMTGVKKIFDLPPRRTGTKRIRAIRPVTIDEFNKVSSYLHSKSLREGLLIDLTYQGALRRIEIPTIKINSFKWELFLDDPTKLCQLSVIGKGDKERIVLINPETAEKIFNYFAERHDNYEDFINSPTLLFQKNGKPITSKEIWKIIHFGSIEAIGRDIRPHELRHARATELANLNVAVQDVKNYLGHSSIATTEIYLHRSMDASIKDIQKTLIKKQ